MNRLTSIMAALGAFGTNPTPTTQRPVYPYVVGQSNGGKTGRQRSYTKKGPGRLHNQGKTNNRHRRLSLATWNKP